MPDFRELSALVRSRMPLVCIETIEEPKVLRLLERLAREDQLAFHSWSVAEGLVHRNFRYGERQPEGQGLFATVERVGGGRDPAPAGQSREIEDTRTLESALHYIDKRGGQGLFVLLDPHPFLEEPVVVRLMREIVLDHAETGRTLVLVSPTLPLPSLLARHAAWLNLRIPDLAGVREILKSEVSLYVKSGNARVKGDTEDVNALVGQLVGPARGRCASAAAQCNPRRWADHGGGSQPRDAPQAEHGRQLGAPGGNQHCRSG